LRPAHLLIAALFVAVPAALAEGVSPTVIVGCFDAQTYPPVYQPNFTAAVRELVDSSLAAAYGEGVEVLDPGDWFFFLDAINMPNVVGAVISLTVREGGTLNLPGGSVDRLVRSFEAGLGLVGIHGPAYSPYFGRLSREVFPVDGDKLAGGKISRVDQIITVRHTHERRADHFITQGGPESFEAADSFLVYRQDQDGSWFDPVEGLATPLYVAKAGSTEVPSIIAYERGNGRSVTFTGLKHTDGAGGYARDRDWYNHSLAIPEVRSLLGRSIVWAVEPLLEGAALEDRLGDSSDFFGERLGTLVPEEAAPGGGDRLAAGSATKMAIVLTASALLILLIAYLGFAR